MSGACSAAAVVVVDEVAVVGSLRFCFQEDIYRPDGELIRTTISKDKIKTFFPFFLPL